MCLRRRLWLQKVLLSITCFVLLTADTTGIEVERAAAAVSPLVTSYKPQVQSVDVNVSYVYSSGATISGVIVTLESR